MPLFFKGGRAAHATRWLFGSATECRSYMGYSAGASAAGSRSYTASSSQGLLLMGEICALTASTRLPIVKFA